LRSAGLLAPVRRAAGAPAASAPQFVHDVQRAQPRQLQRHARAARRAQVDDLARVDGPAMPQRPVRPPHLVLDLHVRVRIIRSRACSSVSMICRVTRSRIRSRPARCGERGLVRGPWNRLPMPRCARVQAPHVEPHLHDALEHPLDSSSSTRAGRWMSTDARSPAPAFVGRPSGSRSPLRRRNRATASSSSSAPSADAHASASWKPGRDGLQGAGGPPR